MVKLLDLGISEFYVVNKTRSINVGTKPYKAPELLFEYKDNN